MDDDDQMERIDRLEAKVDELSELVRHLSAMIIQQNDSNVRSSTPERSNTTRNRRRNNTLPNTSTTEEIENLRVKVIKGDYKGLKGRVTGLKGTQFWKIKLDGCDEVISKMPKMLEILSDSWSHSR